MSLQRKILTLVLLCLMVPISVIGIFVNFKINEILRKDVNQINQYILDKVYIQLERELNVLDGVFHDVIQNNMICLYLIGHTTNFQQKMDPILAEYPEIQRVYIETNKEGLAFAQPHAYPAVSEDLGVDNNEKPVWVDKWLERPVEEMGVWDGPYIAPDGEVSLIVAGPAYSISKKVYGLVTFQVNIETLKRKVIGDLERDNKEIHFVTANGIDYITGKDYSQIQGQNSLFDESVNTDKNGILVTIENTKYLAFQRYFPRFNSYLLILENETSAYASRNKVKSFILTVSILAFLITSIVTLFFIKRLLVNPIHKLQLATGKVAKGDLTIYTHLKRKDELGHLSFSFNQMTQSLKDVISLLIDASEEVQKTCGELSSSFQEIAASNTLNNQLISELAKISEDQSLNLGESSNLTSNIFSSLQDLAAEMTAAKDNSTRVLNNAKEGQNKIHNTIQMIHDRNENTQNIIYKMNELTVKSKEINEITDLIHQITDQTNLLALNASIEAARAGEAGRGFAVVAGEIRNLAKQSRNATERIDNLIKEVQSRIDHVSGVFESQVKDFNQGVKDADCTIKAFSQIVNDILVVDQNVEGINNQISSLTKTGEAIENNVANVAAQAQESAASAEEIAFSSEKTLKVMERLSIQVDHLTELSEKLGQLKEQFTIIHNEKK